MNILEEPFLLSCDLSTAEARVVYMLTKDPHLIAMAQTLPHEYNMIMAATVEVFKKPSDQISEDEYYQGKRTVHGAHYGLKGFTMSKVLLKEAYVITPDECQRLLENYHASRRPIRDVYFDDIHNEIWNNRRLVNSWGREIRWPYERFTEELYKKGYAFKPQSEIADLLNQWGLKPLFKAIKQHKLRSKISAQIHDELLINTILKEAYWIMQLLKSSLERPRYYYNQPLSIPVKFKIGNSWEGHYEFKKFPARDEFEERVKTMLIPF